jgi:beta-glucosidase
MLHTWMRARAVRFGVVAMVAALIAASGQMSVGEAHASPVGSPWLNAHQPAQQRARELLAVMTQTDKIGLVTHGTVNPALGIPSLGADDGPNGLRALGTFPSGSVTAFPTAENLAASFDTTLASQYGTALGQEAWAKGIGQVFAPVVNIIRTPYWGRQGETFGEDPYLSGQIAASEVSAIEGQHVIATPKHFATNNQETDRFGTPTGSNAIDTVVSQRALQEIYFPPFNDAVSQGGAGSVMCATNRLNGEYSCENSALLDSLRQDGFQGFVIPDTLAAPDPVAAFNAGTDIPGLTAAELSTALQDGTVSESRLNDAVVSILTPMFAAGQFDVANPGSLTADVSTPEHLSLATQESEEGSVLLQNRDNLLPLSSATTSIAVIGEPGTDPTQAQLESGGSAYVCPDPTAPYGLCLTNSGVVTPVTGITARAGAGVTINSAEGSLGDVPLTTVPPSVLTPSAGTGTGLTGTYYPNYNFTGTSASEVDTNLDISVPDCPTVLNNTCAHGAPNSEQPTGATLWSARWTGTLNPPDTGNYVFSVLQSGGAKLSVDGKTIVNSDYNENNASYGLGAPTAYTGLIHLVAGHTVPIELDSNPGGSIQLGWEPPSQSEPMIKEAVAAAAKSDVAVVFVNQNSSEGMDRANLDLPGDQNELISAVAAANPNTIVVLNTAGAVLMPWLGHVKSVIEAWLPGQQDGQAIAALLFGDVNFSGRIPVTWPASPDQGPGQTAAEFPGLNNTVVYNEGIFVGYRYYQEYGQQPLYPFGYGLSYTRFSVRDVHLDPQGRNSWEISTRVTNTGTREGTEVLQVYVSDPRSTGDPPEQLKAFDRVTLEPGQATIVRLSLDRSSFSYFNDGKWVVAPGTYTVSVGTSANSLSGSVQLTFSK